MKQIAQALFALSLAVAVAMDPARTTVQFTLGDVLHTVRGNFKLTRGSMTLDPATGAAGGAMVIDARSGDSGSEARDSRMHKNILESARYPQIVFAPDRVQGHLAPAGTSHLEVHGQFTIHGQSHEMTLPVDVQMTGPEVTASTHFTVPYVKWGMKNPSNFLLKVNPTVDIDIKTTATLTGAVQ